MKPTDNRMKFNYKAISFVGVIFFVGVTFFSGCCQHVVSQNLSDKEKIVEAYKAVNDYHSSSATAGYVVKVVYFHGNDQAPLADWEKRLPEVLDDVSNYYKSRTTGINKYQYFRYKYVGTESRPNRGT